MCHRGWECRYQNSGTGSTSFHPKCIDLEPVEWPTGAIPSHKGIPLIQLPDPPAKAPPSVFLGRGIPSIPRRVADRILAGEMVDFADLPPAKKDETETGFHPNGG